MTGRTSRHAHAAASGAAARERERRRDRGFLLAAAAAAAMVLAVLLHTLWSPPAAGPAEQRADGGREPARQAARQAAPEPERCADGSDPAAGLRPDSGGGPAVRRITERGYLIVGVDQDSYRWSYRDPQSGALVGFDVDLVKAIAKDLLGPRGRVVYKAIPTNQRTAALRTHDVDMVVRTMTINCERLKQVAFSTAYFEGGQQVLVPHRSRITGYDDSVAGSTLCTAKGSTGDAALRRQSYGAKVVTVPNQLDCLVRLQLGQVDGVVTDNALAAGQAAQDPSVELVGEPFTVEPYGVAMNRKDEDLVRRVNHVLEKFREGGRSSQWQKSYKTWLGDVLDDDSAAPPDPVYRD